MEREGLLRQFSEDRAALERDYQKAQADNVQALAALRADVAERIRKIKVSALRLCMCYTLAVPTIQCRDILPYMQYLEPVYIHIYTYMYIYVYMYAFVGG